jgi:hypothetical protein
MSSHPSLPRFLSRNALARFSEPGLWLNPDFNTLSLRYNKITVLDASFVPSAGLSLYVYGNPIERISSTGLGDGTPSYTFQYGYDMIAFV